MFQSVLQFQFVLATSARKMHFCTSRKALSIDFRDEGVHAKQNLGGIWWNQKSTRLLPWQENNQFWRPILLLAKRCQKHPKTMDLLKCYFHSLVGIPVQHGETTSRETCAYLAPDLRSKHTLLRKNKIAKTYHLPVCDLRSPWNICIYIYIVKFDSRKAPFWLGNAVLGIKLFYVSYTLLQPSLGIWFP